MAKSDPKKALNARSESALSPEFWEPFLKGLSDLGLQQEFLIQDLQMYIRELELWNPKLRLVEARGKELLEKHLLDSLAPGKLFVQLLDYLGEDLSLADLGSGGGLPALMLALLLRNLDREAQAENNAAKLSAYTLYDKQARRIQFLENAILRLKLQSFVFPVQEHLDLLDKPSGTSFAELGKVKALPGNYALISARAFRPLDALVAGALKTMLAPDGWLFFYKGKELAVRSECAQAGIRLEKLALEIQTPTFNSLDLYGHLDEAKADSKALLLPLKVPFLMDERHLLLVPQIALPSL